MLIFFSNLKSNQFFLFAWISVTGAKRGSGKAVLGEVLGFPIPLQLLFITHFSPWMYLSIHVVHSGRECLVLTVPVGSSAIYWVIPVLSPTPRSHPESALANTCSSCSAKSPVPSPPAKLGHFNLSGWACTCYAVHCQENSLGPCLPCSHFCKFKMTAQAQQSVPV